MRPSSTSSNDVTELYNKAKQLRKALRGKLNKEQKKENTIEYYKTLIDLMFDNALSAESNDLNEVQKEKLRGFCVSAAKKTNQKILSPGTKKYGNYFLQAGDLKNLLDNTMRAILKVRSRGAMSQNITKVAKDYLRALSSYRYLAANPRLDQTFKTSVETQLKGIQAVLAIPDFSKTLSDAEDATNLPENAVTVINNSGTTTDGDRLKQLWENAIRHTLSNTKEQTITKLLEALFPNISPDDATATTTTTTTTTAPLSSSRGLIAGSRGNDDAAATAAPLSSRDLIAGSRGNDDAVATTATTATATTTTTTAAAEAATAASSRDLNAGSSTKGPLDDILSTLNKPEKPREPFTYGIGSKRSARKATYRRALKRYANDMQAYYKQLAILVNRYGLADKSAEGNALALISEEFQSTYESVATASIQAGANPDLKTARSIADPLPFLQAVVAASNQGLGIAQEHVSVKNHQPPTNDTDSTYEQRILEIRAWLTLHATLREVLEKTENYTVDPTIFLSDEAAKAALALRVQRISPQLSSHGDGGEGGADTDGIIVWGAGRDVDTAEQATADLVRQFHRSMQALAQASKNNTVNIEHLKSVHDEMTGLLKANVMQSTAFKVRLGSKVYSVEDFILRAFNYLNSEEYTKIAPVPKALKAALLSRLSREAERHVDAIKDAIQRAAGQPFDTESTESLREHFLALYGHSYEDSTESSNLGLIETIDKLTSEGNNTFIDNLIRFLQQAAVLEASHSLGFGYEAGSTTNISELTGFREKFMFVDDDNASIPASNEAIVNALRDYGSEDWILRTRAEYAAAAAEAAAAAASSSRDSIAGSSDNNLDNLIQEARTHVEAIKNTIEGAAGQPFDTESLREHFLALYGHSYRNSNTENLGLLQNIFNRVHADAGDKKSNDDLDSMTCFLQQWAVLEVSYPLGFGYEPGSTRPNPEGSRLFMFSDQDSKGNIIAPSNERILAVLAHYEMKNYILMTKAEYAATATTTTTTTTTTAAANDDGVDVVVDDAAVSRDNDNDDDDDTVSITSDNAVVGSSDSDVGTDDDDDGNDDSTDDDAAPSPSSRDPIAGSRNSASDADDDNDDNNAAADAAEAEKLRTQQQALETDMDGQTPAGPPPESSRDLIAGSRDKDNNDGDDAATTTTTAANASLLARDADADDSTLSTVSTATTDTSAVTPPSSRNNTDALSASALTGPGTPATFGARTSVSRRSGAAPAHAPAEDLDLSDNNNADGEANGGIAPDPDYLRLPGAGASGE